ncbi:MAG: TlpA family protein disulfide reductase [Acidobacteria bacterium]|nr:TlpA family protein disulfide reductase [Acidobacteriota bacterium]
MKNALKNILLFAGAVVFFSSFTGCGGSSSNSQTNSGSNTASANKSSQAPTANASDYPPFQAALADGEIEMLDGTKSKISDRRGKVVLVNLWATWCGPCRGEMPHLIAMQEQYRDQGFQILGLDVGTDGVPEPISTIKSFGQKNNLNYELARVPNDMVSKFEDLSEFRAIPQTFLIDRAGRLRSVFTGGGPQEIEKMKAEVAKVVADGQ